MVLALSLGLREKIAATMVLTIPRFRRIARGEAKMNRQDAKTAKKDREKVN